ncbi:MAG: prephenate dehydratase [Desulfarculales bacterium]|jgi:chorismate mutase/prephenate dehydratase|nr:prephenate dehydratase [Desulfarculales bacterium]
MNEPQNLLNLREEIDFIDNKLWEMINQRAMLAQQLGLIKRKNAQSVVDKVREKQILDEIARKNQDGVLSEQSIKAIFAEIIAACRALQLPCKVGFLGPLGTFSHGAALSYFGRHAILRPYDNLAAAFQDAQEQRLDYVLAPLENSTEGVVGQTLDLLSIHDLNVMNQFSVRIQQSLMARTENLENIDKVASHPQALAQSRGWLSLNLPGVKLVPAASSGAAAAMAEDDITMAIVGPSQLAEFYNLIILAENIEDNKQNQTLFVVVGKGSNPPTENDRTMLWFAAPHRSGSLYECLKPLAQHKINLTRLHSRPSAHGPWQYLFFLEMEGHFADENVRQAVASLQEQAEKCVFIGSYEYESASSAFKQANTNEKG